MFGINGTEALILLILAIVIIGPTRLPTYVQKLTQLVKQVKEMANNAQNQLTQETGQDVDWQKFDPRQYDPRRIIKNAWSDDIESTKNAINDLGNDAKSMVSFTSRNQAGATSVRQSLAESDYDSTAYNIQNNISNIDSLSENMTNERVPFDIEAT